ncbi:uncharacterized protein LOC129608362 [Condylostylus longicornis]|uniref:uncharacterized protein LOC129608362 n=1 Tax=Condylostylus longicornis TaxID=2530218 RepID=UPI00244E1A6E|nr:uncharacterized protein LOC129608362 [Condylostylus longicornis]XP_055375821.1 uncharacterized protein LOC129608362 [Condylostylus longicornis]
MANIPRRRLSSVGDSAPPSDSSEGTASETCDVINQDWPRSITSDPTSNHQFQHQQQKNYQNNINNQNFTTNSTNNMSNINSHKLNHKEQDVDAISTASTILSENERNQVESFFAGLGTEIYVSSSLANLYEGIGKDDWRLIYTGIPVLLHDKGSARSRSIPRITLCLAERGSCFALWRDIIDNSSQYRAAGPSFHTMSLSSNLNQVIGFSFDSCDAAHELWKCIEKLINDPENKLLNQPGSKRKTKKEKKSKPVPLPPKSQISHPCQFHHVTSVTREDAERYLLQTFVADAASGSNKRSQ